VRFLTRGGAYQLFFTDEGATWALARPTGAAQGAGRRARGGDRPEPRPGKAAPDDAPIVDVLRMRLVGASADARVTGVWEQPGKTHYFRGSTPASWRTNVPTFAGVHYSQVYPGIDLLYYGREAQLEYDFIVAGGVDPATIALRFEGARGVSIDEAGDLVVTTPAGLLVQRKPVAYQDVTGTRRVIDCRYVLGAGNHVGFALGPYDEKAPLVIDPVLVYSSFLGGTGGSYGEQAYGVAVDHLDNVYVTGKTLSTTFPAAGGSLANNDMFVVKMTAAGALAYSVVVNGSASDSGEAIAVDAGGNAVVTGFTDSSNFPLLNPIHLDRASRDAFLMKLDPSGLIVYSTYLGGSSSFDYGEAVAIDGEGNAYIAGVTQSADFPVLNALQPLAQGQDAFVLKVDPAGGLVFGTFLGGTGSEAGESVAVETTGSFYVTGWTTSSNFPRVNSPQGKQSGQDVFVTRYAPDGSAYVYSRFLGGNSHERAFAIAVDEGSSAWVGGRTDSTNFPAVLPLQANQPGTDAFLAKIGPDGATAFATYLGGSDWEIVFGLSLKGDRLYATGQTFSADFPAVNAVQSAKAGDAATADAFVIGLDTLAQSLVFSTFLGGAGMDEGRGVAAASGANVFAAGWTESSDFPTVRPLQESKSNVGNVFISRLAPLGVDEVAPAFVTVAGGDAITITGRDFAAGATVHLGGVPATNVAVLDSTTITATTPSLPAGATDVIVTNPDGGSGTLYGELLVLSGTGPVAEAGPDQSVEAIGPSGGPVVLDGTSSFDPDNEPMTFEWRDEQNNILGSSALLATFLPLGVHTITLTVSDGHSAPGVDTVTVSVVDTTAPVAAVTAPNGGQKIFTGTPTILEWSASDAGSGLASFDVYLSTNGGSTYNPTPICAGISGALRSCTWASPGPTTGKARIKVIARDGDGNTSSDVSDANFSIVSGTAWVKVTAPNTNVNWGAGSTQQIQWKHNLGAAAFVRLEASVDGGASWSLITAAVKNSASSTGVYNWTIPGPLSSAARIRVSWKNGPVTDQSDTNFTVAAPFIALSGPSAGTNWGYGTTQKLTWSTNLGPLDRVSVLLSTDGGASYPLDLARGIQASAKSAVFETPTLGSATTTARTRVVWTNPPAGFAGEGANTAGFRIEPPFVALTTPNGGETWSAGAKKAIKWSHNLGLLENVRVELSQDDGATYAIVVIASTRSDGSQSVTVGSSWLTPTARLRISWTDSGLVNDVSNGSFVIQ
jgi:hypothetical protein